MSSLRERIKGFFSPKGLVWFLSPGMRGAEEDTIITDLENFAGKFSETVSSLEGFIGAYTTGDVSMMRLSMEKTVSLRRSTEDHRKRITQTIADKRMFFPDSREDMISIMNSMSLVLSVVEDVRVGAATGKAVDPRLGVGMLSVARDCSEMAALIVSGIEYLNRDPLHAFSETFAVSKAEDSLRVDVEAAVQELEGIDGGENVGYVVVMLSLLRISEQIKGVLGNVEKLAVKYL